MDFEHNNLDQIADSLEQNDGQDLESFTREASVNTAMNLQAAGSIPGLRAGTQNTVVLPAGVELDDIRVVGRDLVISLPDGSNMVIPDGAVFIPQIVIDGVSVPPLNLAALLLGNEPQPAAGPPQSSGGNFADPVGDIGDPFALGDLLPPTALAFIEAQQDEIFPFEPDEDDAVPDVVIITPENPAGSASATSSVDESGLPARGAESEGTNASGNGETTVGTIIFNPGDEPTIVSIAGLSINGQAITAVGQTVQGTFGTLTITSINNGSIGYSYTLSDNTNGDDTSDFFEVSVIDSDGDKATANLTINIIDDVPTAVMDSDSIAAGEYGPATGNVITDAEADGGADTQGADGAVVAGVAAGDTGTVLLDAGTVGTTIAGLYGVLTLNSDGSYSYVRNADSPGGVQDVFTYTLQDGDGDTSVTTLTIDIADSPVTLTLPVSGEAGAVVDEEGLPARGAESPGSNAVSDLETTSGTISYSAADGPATVTINGVAVTAVGQTFVGASGTLTITGIANGAITYSYTLTDNTSGDNTSDDFAIVITDQDGDNATGTLSIAIIDDVPTAVMDSDSIAAGEYGPATGNVITDSEADGGADTQGADGAVVAGVAAGDTGTVLLDAGTVGTTIAGLYGVLTLNSDGSYSYVRNADSPGGVQDVFTYTLQDGDGDTSVTTLTIDIADSPVTLTLPVSGEAGAVVDEEGLPARGAESPGSNAVSDLETTSGTISYSAADGPATVTINGVAVTAVGQTFVGASGTLTITGIANGAITYSYTLTDNTSGDNTSDDFAIVITDQDGDNATGTLSIAIIDDVPTAVMDSDSIAAGEYGPATGNVITDAEADGGADTQGADGAVVAGVAAGDTGTVLLDAGTVGTTIAGLYGVLTLNSDGSYSYVRNADSPGGVQDVFTYTLQDGDGDTSVTTLTIDIADSPVTLTLPVSGEAGAVVDEEGLPARGAESPGSNAVSDLETTSGTISYSAADGPATVTINGVAVTAVGQTFVGASGTLTITGIANGAITYSYTLTDNTSGDNTSDDFAIVITDQDGDNATGTLSIAIIDDVPTAVMDSDSIAAGEYGPATGNVITDAEADGGADTQGADGAVVAGVAAGDTGTVLLDAATVGTTVNGLYGVLTLNSDGSYSYVRNADSPGGVQDVFTYTLQDGDGDTSVTTLTIDIADSPVTLTLPVSGEAGTVVDESGLPARGAEPEGTDEPADSETTAGTITFDAPDGPGTVTINGVAVTSVGQTFAGSSGTLTITGIANGSITYSYTLTDNTSGDVTSDSFAIVVTDIDGDVSDGILTIDIVDDAPVAVDELAITLAEDAPGAVGGNVLANDTQGADGAVVTSVTIGGLTTAINAVGTTDVVTANGTYTFTAAGAWTFDPNPNLDQSGGAIDASFTYTITDGDGDIATAKQPISITDGADPVAGEPITLTLDDQNLADGSTPAGPDFVNGTITFTPGSDAITSIVFGTDLGALAGGLTWVRVDGNTITGSDGTNVIVTLTLSVSSNVATVTATLNDNYNSHPVFTADDLQALGSVTVVATDTDGDIATGTVNINVSDDVPTATDEASQDVNEGATVTGTLDFVQGADGATVTHINGVLLVFTAGPAEFSDWVDIGDGMIRVKADGSYEFTADNPTISPVAPTTATFTVTDGDGDTATANVSFQIVDANVPTAGTTTAAVDDDGLAGGNPASMTGDLDSNFGADGVVGGGDDDADGPLSSEATFSGTLTLNFGGDGAGTADFASMDTLTGMVGQETVTYSWNALTNTLTATGPRGVLFTVEVTNPATGAYKVTLVDNVLHAQGPNDENDASVSLNYNVTDADGSVAAVPGTLTITFDDDVPTATDEASQDVNEGATVTGTLDFVQGADGATVTHINGVLLVFTAGPAEFSDWVDIGDGMIRVKADGSYEFTADNPTISPVAPTTATFTVTDGDGDTATANVSFQIVDANVPTAGTTTAAVDDDGLAGGNPASMTGDLDSNFGADGVVGGGDDDADGPLSSEATFSGTLTLNFGGDGAGTADFASMDTLTGMVGQETVTYSWNALTNTLTATGPRGVLFTVEVTNPATGAYKVTLVDNVLHAQGPNDENDASVSLNYNVTDADGSVAAVPGTLTITFDDDAPTATDEASQDVNEGATVTGTLDFVQGADGATVTHINGVLLVFTAGPAEFSDWVDIGDGMIRVKADGSYEFTADNPTISPVAPTTATFTVTDGDGDTATANVSFQIVDANVPTAGTTTAAVDDDGLAGGNPASMTGDLDSNFGADGVVGGGDDDADGPLSSEATFSGTLTLNFGGDGAGTADFASMDTLTGMVGQETVTYSWNALTNTLTATGPRGVLFTVEVTNPATGAYKVTLVDNVLHAQGPNDENDASVSLNYNVTDADGSVAAVPGTLTITFDDDAPTATDEASQDVNEGATVTGTLDFVQGADGATVTHINGVLLVFTAGPAEFSDWVDIGDGMIRVKADGSYEFTADNPTISPVAPTTATFTVTDGDGDTATANVSFQIVDANVPTAGTTTAAVDDDGLAGGNPASMTGDLDSNFGADGVVGGGDDDADGPLSSEATFSGTLTLNFGGDGAGTADFASMDTLTGMVGQETVTYSWNALTNTLTATGPRGVLFTVEVTNPATGAYKVTLVDNVLHAQGPNDENDASVSLNYNVTDADGSVAAVPGTLTITFDDDVPTATDEASQDVNEGATVTGTLDFVQGADGATVTHINGVLLVFTAGPAEFSDWVDIGDGMIRVKADGSYEFTADNPTISPVAPTTATFTVTDGDGDTATANVSFQIVDANVPTAGTTTAAVDDDGLAGGNPASMTGDLDSNFGADGVVGGGDDDADGPLSSEATFSGTLTLNFGGDGAGTADFASMDTLTGMVGQETVTYSWNALTNTLTATGPRGVLFTVEVTNPATGAYKVTLVDNVLHAQGPNDENDASVSLNYNVTDADGSVAAVPGTLTITFDDDAPTATDEASQDVNEGATVTGTLDFVQGADGATVTHINGVLLVFTAGPAEFSDWVDIGDGMIRVKADGSYEFTADNPTISPVAPTTATFTVTDGDGDTATANVSFQIVDANVPTAGTTTAAVDDDGLAGGNPASMTGDLDSNFGADGVVGGGDDDADGPLSSEATFSGTLTLNFGGDGAGTADFASMDTLTGMVGQETVTYSWNALTNTLTATGPRGVLFTVEVTNPATGAYKVTLVDNVLHAQGPNDENDASVSLNYNVTDADGSVAAVPGTLTITFDDDAPTATDEASQDVNEGATVTGTLDFVQGADGATVTHINGVLLVFTAGPAEFSDWVDIGDGMIRVKADGSYEFTADNPTISPVAPTTATFTVTDGDGDTATANVSFQIVDANVPTAGISAALVDDDGLAGGNPLSTIDGATDANADTDNNAATFGGTLTHNFGGDGAGSINFASMDTLTAAIGQETVTYSWAGGTLSATITGGARDGTVLFTVEVTNPATGAYTVTLLDNVLHALGPNEENAIDPVAALTYTVLDADGSSATGTLNVSFDDDAPTLSSFSDETIANAAGQIANGTFTYAPGADDHASFNITGPTLDGVTNSVVQNANGALLTATVDGSGEILYTLQVNTDGTYEFTLVTPDAGTTEVVSLLGLTAGGPTPFVELPDGTIEFTGSGAGVNSSTAGFGVDNQRVRDGESFTLEFHNPGQPGDQAPGVNPNFVDALTFGINNVNGGNVIFQWTATNTVTGDTDTGTFTVSAAGSVLIDPNISFNFIEIAAIGGTASAGQGARFSSVDVLRNILPQDQDLPFQVSAVDGDGDVTQLDDFNVFVDASLAPTIAPLAPMSPIAPTNFLGFENEPEFQSSDNGERQSFNDNGGLLFQNANGLGANVALIKPAVVETANSLDTVDAKPAAKAMLANSNEAQSARAAVKAPTTSQIVIAATLLAANGRPEESTGSNDAPVGELGNSTALDFNSVQNQAQPEAVQLEGIQAANDEAASTEEEAASSGSSAESAEPAVETGIADGSEMIAEESSGNNDAQPGFDVAEFQSASGLQLDMGIAMNVEALTPVGDAPLPVQIDITAPETPPADLEEIVADAIDGGSLEIVSIDVVIESFAGSENDGGRGAIEHLPEQALPEQILDMFVQGDAGPLANGVSDGMQTQIDMAEAGHASG